MNPRPGRTLAVLFQKNNYSVFILSCFLFLFSCRNLFAQNHTHTSVYSYARTILDTLTSPLMHGRGYTHQGDKLAAAYIEKEFVRAGLLPFGNTYRQEFSLSINTFPGGAGLGYRSFNNYLRNGARVLVNCDAPYTPPAKGRIIWFDSLAVSSPERLSAFRKKNFKGKVMVIDEKGISSQENGKLIKEMKGNPYGAAALVTFNNKRLMWDASCQTAAFPGFEVLVPDSIHDSFKKEMKKSGGMYYFAGSKLIPDYKTQNLIGFVKGSVYPDSFIVFTAHYDHLGRMDKETYFPGANDNASGCAMLLNLAKYYSLPENKPRCSLAFMAFSGEEAGLLGSHYYTEHPVFPLKNIRFLTNLDILGTGDEGITVVNGTIFPEEFIMLQALNNEKGFLAEVKSRGKASNSDHYFFSEHGVRSFFIYTRGGIKAYHDIYDKSSTLPLTKFEDLFRLLCSFEKMLDKR